jgi:hypothetical protein
MKFQILGNVANKNFGLAKALHASIPGQNPGSPRPRGHSFFGMYSFSLFL